jgi:hypothetical protein
MNKRKRKKLLRLALARGEVVSAEVVAEESEVVLVNDALPVEEPVIAPEPVNNPVPTEEPLEETVLETKNTKKKKS